MEKRVVLSLCYTKTRAFFILEKFKLLRGGLGSSFFLAIKYFHHPELFVGYGHYAHMPFLGKYAFHSFYMYIGVFAAGAVANIDGKLEHGKAIGHYFLAESGSSFVIFFTYHRQIEKNKYPHNSVFV